MGAQEDFLAAVAALNASIGAYVEDMTRKLDDLEALVRRRQEAS